MEAVIKAKKLNMSQMFLENGRVVPTTRLKVDEESVSLLDDSLVGKSIILQGISKGKGFAGVMKRWGFKGGPATRGQSTYPRQAGSIGAQTPGRVLKGKKMAGHMGNRKVTIKGSKILSVQKDKGEIFVSGPVPGARNSEVKIKFS